MKHADVLKTVTGGLAIVLLFSGCASGDKKRTAANQRTNETVAATEQAVPSGLATACSSRRDARGKIIYDDPACPERYGRQYGELATVCSSYSSYVDADRKVVYDDPNSPNRQPRLDPTSPDRQAGLDPNSPDRQPHPMTTSAEETRANYDAAVKHVRKAEAAGDQGNIPEMVRHAKLSLDQVRAHRAPDDANLNSAVVDLKETIVVGCRDEIAPSALRDARAKLSRVAYGQRPTSGAMTGTGLSTQTVTGQLIRDPRSTRTDGGEHYVLRDRQEREIPISLSPEMSSQVHPGDMVEAQIDSKGQVVAISQSQ